MHTLWALCLSSLLAKGLSTVSTATIKVLRVSCCISAIVDNGRVLYKHMSKHNSHDESYNLNRKNQVIS